MMRTFSYTHKLSIAICVLFAISFFPSPSNADIITYEKDKLLPAKLWRVVLGRGMYAPQDAPRKSPPGNGMTWVKANMTFTRLRETEDEPIDNDIVIHYGIVQEDDPTGSWAQDVCEKKADHEPNQWNEVTFKNIHNVQLEYNITKTGLWYLVWASCHQDNPVVLLDGHEIWMNPFGYLRGRLYPFLPFATYMLLIYIALMFVWMIASFINWSELLRLQHYISVVISLGIVEWMFAYFDFDWLNTHGSRNLTLLTFSTLATVFKKTLSRVLVLCVSMGYGIVRPTLGDKKPKVIMFTILFFVATLTYDLSYTFARHNNNISEFWLFLALWPVSLADSILCIWVLTSINKTTQGLKAHGQTAKLEMYSRFVKVLVCTVLLAFLFILFQFAEMAMGRLIVDWKITWIYEGFWHILSVLVLIAVMVIWRPHANTKQYVYSQQLSSADDDLEGGGDREMHDLGSNGTNGLFTLNDESSDVSDGFDADENHPQREQVADSAEER